MPSYAGIDLTCSSKKKSAYALLGADINSHDNLRIERMLSIHKDSEIIVAIEQDRPVCTGIDAPLGRPKGLCCLDDACTCQPVHGEKGRSCERELAREGIPCYFTTKRSIIKDMVGRAIVLKAEFESRGLKVIEVYPYATKRRLWGISIPRKTTALGRQFIRGRVSVTITNIDEYQGLSHDHYDAIVAAYTAYLHQEGLTELIGDPDEGQIATPRGFPDYTFDKKVTSAYI